jgi:hypothetical protein
MDEETARRIARLFGLNEPGGETPGIPRCGPAGDEFDRLHHLAHDLAGDVRPSHAELAVHARLRGLRASEPKIEGGRLIVVFDRASDQVIGHIVERPRSGGHWGYDVFAISRQSSDGTEHRIPL